MAGLMQIALSILLVAGIGKAQIPVPCADAVSLARNECCPIPPNAGQGAGQCGMNLSTPRGHCVDISNDIPIDRSDPRVNWPRFYFTRVCECTSNYSGYDCGECAFGYRGDNCDQTYTRRRRPTSELEWTTYIGQLRMAKNKTSRYRVITSPPDYDNLAALQTQPISVYNLFVWFHHYIAKDNHGETPDEDDYAHEATGFPTWHRLFLLWFEREMQNMTGDDNFTVHYWDWRDPNERNSLFTRVRLGEHRMDTAEVEGPLFDGWQTVCWYNGSGNVTHPEPEHRICDPNVTTGPVQRCPNERTCEPNYEGWPSYEDVQNAVDKQDYDLPNYNKYSPAEGSREGFRGFMEGFQVIDECDRSTILGRDLCTNVNIEGVGIKGLQRLLHNTVHITLGLGSFLDEDNVFRSDQKGVMGDVAASANDPIFINHHAMVDCILEEWLQKNKRMGHQVNYPTDNNNLIRQGHRGEDYIVPFIPLYTHNAMFKVADELGYMCNLPDQPTTGPTTTTRATTTRATRSREPTTEPDSAKDTTALLYVLVLAIVGCATFILFF